MTPNPSTDDMTQIQYQNQASSPASAKSPPRRMTREGGRSFPSTNLVEASQCQSTELQSDSRGIQISTLRSDLISTCHSHLGRS